MLQVVLLVLPPPTIDEPVHASVGSVALTVVANPDSRIGSSSQG